MDTLYLLVEVALLCRKEYKSHDLEEGERETEVNR